MIAAAVRENVEPFAPERFPLASEWSWSGLVSLWEIMQRLQPARLVVALNALSGLQYALRLSKQIGHRVSMTAEHKRYLTDHAKSVSVHLKEIGLSTSKKSCDRLAGALAEWATVARDRDLEDDLLLHVNQFITCVQDELLEVIAFAIPKEKFKYLDPFGGNVEERFPSARKDIEEAGKCLAAGRNTACVFHLMRVMELALVVFGRAVGVIKKSPSWDAILGAVDKKLHPPPGTKKTEPWRKHEPWFAEANTLLRGVKIAWRNPTMHVTRNYDEEEAAEVYASVKAFMCHLATKLRERRPRS